MAKYGFKFPAQSVSDEASGLYDLSQFPDIAWMKQTGLMVPLGTTAAGPHLVTVPAAQRAAYSADSSRCGKDANKSFGALPSGTQYLQNAWDDVFIKIQASLQVQETLAKFSTCVQEAGAPANYSQNFNRFAVWAAAQMTDPQTGVLVPATDQRWGHVFVQCGQSLAALYERLQTAAQAQFFQDHYQEINQLEAKGTAMVSAAERLLQTG